MGEPDRVPGGEATGPGAEPSALGADPPRTPAEAPADVELGRTVAALTADDLESSGRRRLLGRLAGDVRRRGVGRLFRPRAALRWMADVVADVAPHVPVRNRETLRRHFPGLDDDALADRLIRNAARATAGVGAAGGGVASIEWIAAPTLLTAPVLLAAETVAVVAVELKLIGELHEVYGEPIPGNGTERALTLVQSWAGRRGVNPLVPGAGVAGVLSTAARRELQMSLLRRFGRNLTTMGPMLSGAAVAGYLNRRSTRAVGEKVRDELRERALKRPDRRVLGD
ncbi:hypothetical protein [Actinoplanes teichomyceticus]|uniref:EcsC family protein n=1 Tax=Actinoplanes teichomyceticus TaxID=1867 RepID=A0A561WMY7_ACTTI|nr:hypothetical protein [Actinoplanes teichomyceticus]TWG25226.1 hypothetical protein FHX34_101192 [Actinoplanes teichomyceticus]GIF10295.1 hypothetical protein Ate01nite_03270 [Actinoplanes teichomyceticus]